MKILSKLAKIIAILIIVLIFYFAGYLVGHKNIVFEENFKPKVINTELSKPKDVDFSIFWDAWKLVTEKYVGEYSPQKMVYGAIKGMVEALDDPYSTFLEPGANKVLLEDLSGAIQGIGAELSKKDDQLIIVAPLDDSPAQKAGLKAQDEILEINGESTTNMSLDQAIEKIRGPAGSEVTLLINRSDLKEPKEFKIKREVITIKSVQWEMKDNIGIMKITQFADDTKDLTIQAADELLKKNPKAIILDLRNNPGGYLETSIDVASLFMDRGVVVKEQYKDGRKEELKTTLDGKLKNLPVFVLVNEGSASASEIVAGALKDSRNATLIGRKTFGKGSVQELENLSSGSALKITVAKWLTPKDKTIDKEGIKPDIEIDLTDADLAAGRDPQLDRALEEARK